MPTRNAEARWQGDLKSGTGTMKLGSGAYEGRYSFASRFESGTGTNPEELIGAAHAGCFSMALTGALNKAGFQPRQVHTVAKVHLEKQGEGFAITAIDLETEADVPGIDEATFRQQAEAAKSGCPVSKALVGVSIRLNARLGATAGR
jgi:osmotically inducible protein OsmC